MAEMKITAGLGSLEFYDAFADAGADEFFAGFLPFEWLEKYGNITPINRREVLMHSIQLHSFDEMRLLAQKIETHGIPVALTFNSICYLPEQYPLLAELLNRLGRLGFRDWILADPGLLLYLKQQGIKGRIHLSGEAGCFNPDGMHFFRRFGIARWIFPRKMTPEDMAACAAAAPECEYEAFFLNERCQFSGAFCSSLHCDELDHICHVPYLPSGPDILLADDREVDPGRFGAGGCGLCALPLLRKAGITHLKIVGRGAHPEFLERDIRLVRRAVDMGDVSAETLRRVILQNECSKNCYYPVC